MQAGCAAAQGCGSTCRRAGAAGGARGPAPCNGAGRPAPWRRAGRTRNARTRRRQFRQGGELPLVLGSQAASHQEPGGEHRGRRKDRTRAPVGKTIWAEFGLLCCGVLAGCARVDESPFARRGSQGHCAARRNE